jgi:hypothetical protein
MPTNLRNHSKIRRVAAGCAFASLLVAGTAAFAKLPPSLKGPIATVGDRTVEAIDVERAGQALANHPSRQTTPRAWRRFLLNRCVDRELLAAEAARRGLAKDPAVARRIAGREYLVLKRELEAKVLIPDITPSPEEFARIKKEALYQYIDLYYILVRDDATGVRRTLAEKIARRARAGGAWDSLARLYSGHPPSAAAGGHFGPTLIRDIDPSAQKEVIAGAPGDVFGPYSGPYGHEVYKLGGFIPMDDDSLMRLLVDERTRQIWSRNDARLLEKYHFAPDTTNARLALRALASEAPDSILATLGPDGTRPALGLRAPLGILARADGESVTVADVFRITPPAINERGVAHVRNEAALAVLTARVLIPTLLVRDAEERGLDRDPLVARELRLIRDEEATKAMVAGARPPDPDAAALRAYVETHAARYRWPLARRVRVVMFANPDSARAALKQWNGIGVPADSVLARMGFRTVPRPDVDNIFPGGTGAPTLYDDRTDPLSRSVRGLDVGQFAPVTAVPQGWAVIVVTGREEPRPMTEEEAAPRALRDWREEAEDQWVSDLLVKLRSKTAVQVVPARLEAVRLLLESSETGGRAK